MINLDVYFNHDDSLDGQALLEGNLITGDVKLLLKGSLFVHETKHFIDKATKLLKQRYDVVNVNVHWDSIKIDIEKEGN